MERERELGVSWWGGEEGRLEYLCMCRSGRESSLSMPLEQGVGLRCLARLRAVCAGRGMWVPRALASRQPARRHPPLATQRGRLARERGWRRLRV